MSTSSMSTDRGAPTGGGGSDPRRRGPRGPRRIAGVLGLVVALAAPLLPATDGAGPARAEEHGGAEVIGSVEQVQLWGADPGTPARLYDPQGEPVTNDALPWSVDGDTFSPGGEVTDDHGALVFRGALDEELLAFSGIPAGAGYTVEFVEDGQTVTSSPVTVLAPDEHPDQTFYDGQSFGPDDFAGDGLTYLETRDGTLLSVLVDLPGAPEDGPYPTLVEYSGYDVSAPPEDTGLPVNLGAPTMAIGQLLGYATVAVNIRGTGCSGGAFDYFETLQALDGYDAVEAVAAQPWSANVATTGVSYPGISQLFLAATQPPSLAAAAPMAVISDHARDTVLPGGIFNTGFAREWAEGRERDTRFPDGQAWVDDLVGSDHPAAQQCARNVALRDQNLPLLDRIQANEHASDLWDSRSPWSFAADITTNLFIVNSWQDEQTGGRSAALLDALDLERNDRTVRFVGTNGTHIETLGPEILTDLIEFLELYVAERTPRFTERDDFDHLAEALGLPPEAVDYELVAAVLIPELYGGILGEQIDADDVRMPDDRFAGTSHADALAAYEDEPAARILFETGAGEGPDGFPAPAFDHRFDWGELPGIAALRGGFDEQGRTFELRGDATLRAPGDQQAPPPACAGAPSSGFEDATGPHGGAIDCLSWYRITRGVTDTVFGTQRDVRRDQTASFVTRLLGRVDDLVLPEARAGAFPDVTEGPHLAAVETLAGYEPPIVAGFPDGRFRPGADVTRGQIASMLVRALDEIARQHGDLDPLPPGEGRFSDVAGSPHEEAITRLAGAGMVAGYGDGRFGTQHPATRGQIASMLAGVLDLLVAQGVVPRPAGADAGGAVSEYVYDPARFPAYNFDERPGNADVWTLQPAYHWRQPPEDASLSFTTAPFDQDRVMVGSAGVELWLDSDLDDADVEVVLSEVRPDGSEMYVTTGWLRASKRALDEATSTVLRPRPTFRESDVAPLTADGYDLLRIETFPFGHAFRAGSRLRLSVEAPGGNRPLWRFDETVEGGADVRNRVAHDADHPSRVVLPIVSAELGELPDLAACTPSDGGDEGMTAVRGQPCRAVP